MLCGLLLSTIILMQLNCTKTALKPDFTPASAIALDLGDNNRILDIVATIFFTIFFFRGSQLLSIPSAMQ